MNEALKFIPKDIGPQFKDGDGGGDTGKLLECKVDVVDNGYILSAMFDTVAGINEQGMPFPETIEEVYMDSASLLKRMAELVKS